MVACLCLAPVLEVVMVIFKVSSHYDIVIRVRFEVGQELRMCFLDQLFPMLINLLLFFSRQSFPSHLDDVAGRDVRAIF
jgi:hypothetical protein